MPSNATRFYIGQRFRTYDDSGKLIGKIGVLKITHSSVFYVNKDNINKTPIPRVSTNTANRNIFNGSWKQYFGED